MTRLMIDRGLDWLGRAGQSGESGQRRLSGESESDPNADVIKQSRDETRQDCTGLHVHDSLPLCLHSLTSYSIFISQAVDPVDSLKLLGVSK